MPELPLNEVEEWYINDINEIFIKHKKNLQKYIDKLEKLLVELKHALSKIKERESNVEIDENIEKYLERFQEKVKESLNAIQIPESPTHRKASDFLEDIRKLFIVMNESGRKNIRHFSEHFKIELKEMDLITRKISDMMVKTDEFLRKKYGEVKDAENMVKKIPKLENLTERIEKTKITLNNFNSQKEQLADELKNLEDDIIEIENSVLFKKSQKLEIDIMKIRMEIEGKLKFKKALKKLKKRLEGSGSIKGITAEQVKKYISDPVNTIARDGENHPNLTDFLIQLRFLLESDGGSYVQLKSEVRTKTLQNIKQIITNETLKENIKNFNEMNENLRELKRELDKQQLTARMEKIKEKVSMKTQELTHLTGDINHKLTEYRGLLEKLKEEREEIQNQMKKIIDKDIKIQITLKY